MTNLLLTLLKSRLLNVVAFIRTLGYLGQIAGGLHLAGTLSFIGALPLVIWGNNNYEGTGRLNLLRRNALNIHSYVGVITSLPIILFGITSYRNTGNLAYLEISLLGSCLVTAYMIFKSKLPSTRSKFINTKRYIYLHKHQIGSAVLLIGNIFQYHSGVILDRGGLSLASIFFVIATFTQFFVKSHVEKKVKVEEASLSSISYKHNVVLSN